MSTILKALRRLESEKPHEPQRALRDDVVALRPGEPQEPRSDRMVWWAGGTGAALVLLVVLAVWPRAARIPDARTLAGARPERVAPAPAPTAPERLVPPTLPSRADVEPTSERRYRLPDPEPLAAFEAPSAPPSSPEPASALAPAAPVAQPAPPQAPPAPEAHVDSTTWHPDPARRLAVVSAPGRDAVTLREGDAIGELVVRRIEPAGVVFLYRGEELRRAVGD